MRENSFRGYFVAVDGPNGSGKSTIIELVKEKLVSRGYDVCITKEPTDTELGIFVRHLAEKHYGMSLACLVTADRYEHIKNIVIPELSKGKIVISDRYVLSSLILQGMDEVSPRYILELNSEIIKPDLQVAVFADEMNLNKRLSKRSVLTRFEKGNQSREELIYMKKGIEVLKQKNINILCIDNNENLEGNVEKIIAYIVKGKN